MGYHIANLECLQVIIAQKILVKTLKFTLEIVKLFHPLHWLAIDTRKSCEAKLGLNRKDAGD